jgi:hypothetical protein
VEPTGLEPDVVVGVDNKEEHVAVLLDGLGGRLDQKFIPTTTAGFADLLAFCRDHVGAEPYHRERYRKGELA